MHYNFIDDFSSKKVVIKSSVRRDFFGFADQNDECMIITLVVLCGFVTREELIEFGFSYIYVHKILRGLMQKGLIEKRSISYSGNHRVSCSDYLYTYTKKGYDFVKSIKGGKKVHNDYRKKGENPMNLHDYLTGLNLVESLVGLNSRSATWQRERVFGDYRRDKKTLACDAELWLAATRMNIYFEEDLGNEPNDTILSKLISYQKYSSSGDVPVFSAKNPADVVVFSLFNPTTLTGAAYSQGRINKLSDYLKDVDMGLSLYSYYHEHKDEMPPEIADTAFALLEASKDEKKKDTVIMGGRVRKIDIDPIKEEKRRYGRLKISDVMEMKSDFSGNNPFYQNAFRKGQYEYFMKKRRSLIDTLLSKRNGKFESIYDEVLRGCPLYCVPTCMVSRYIRFIGEFLTYGSRIRACLEDYFGKIDLSDYRHRAVVGDFGPGNFCLRNVFSCDTGTLAIEFMNIDLGAAERIKIFHRYEKYTNGPVHLIVIVDSVKDAFNLSDEIEDFDRHRTKGIDSYNGKSYLYNVTNLSDIFYLRREDLESGNAEKLFFVSGRMDYVDENGKKIMMEENVYRGLLPAKRGNIL